MHAGEIRSNKHTYNVWTKGLNNKQRVELERIVIRSTASLLINKSSIESAEISTYKLTNDKIDK